MLIVVFGLPGTGKSFFAEKLASALHTSYYNTDIVREHLDKKGSYSARDKQQVYEELIHLAGEAIRSHKHVVVDGTFSSGRYRELLTQTATEEKTKIFWIKTEADDATVRKRVSQSRKHSEADYAVYQKVRTEFEGIDFPHLVLDSGRLSVEEMIRKAKQYIFSSYDSD